MAAAGKEGTAVGKSDIPQQDDPPSEVKTRLRPVVDLMIPHKWGWLNPCCSGCAQSPTEPAFCLINKSWVSRFTL